MYINPYILTYCNTLHPYRPNILNLTDYVSCKDCKGFFMDIDGLEGVREG